MEENSTANNGRIAEPTYNEAINELIRSSTLFSESMHIAFFLFLNDEQKLIFVSNAFTELTGISQDDIQKSKIMNLGHLVHEKDIELLKEVKIKSEKLLSDYRLQGEDIWRIIFTTNYRILAPNGGYRYIDHQSYPIYLDDPSFPLISANIMRPSRKKGIDRLTVYFSDKNIQLLYSRKQKRFVQEHKMQLKEVEIEILKLTAAGYTEKQIYDKLKVNPSLVNYHKREIFNKLNVDSMREAVYIALLARVI